MSSTTSNGVPVDLGAIIASLQSAETQNEIFALAGLAFADIAQQTGAISDTLGSVVAAIGKTDQAGALNIAATINAGSAIGATVSGNIEAAVTIDGLGKQAEDLLAAQLSKAARAIFTLWSLVDSRIGRFETALDRSIGKVANGICALKPSADDIGTRLCDLTGELKEVKQVLERELKCICDGTQEIGRCIAGEANRKSNTDQELIEAITAKFDMTEIRMVQIAEQTAAAKADTLRREINDVRIAIENKAENMRIRLEQVGEQVQASRAGGGEAAAPNVISHRTSARPQKR